VIVNKRKGEERERERERGGSERGKRERERGKKRGRKRERERVREREEEEERVEWFSRKINKILQLILHATLKFHLGEFLLQVFCNCILFHSFTKLHFLSLPLSLYLFKFTNNKYCFFKR